MNDLQLAGDLYLPLRGEDCTDKEALTTLKKEFTLSPLYTWSSGHTPK